MKKVSYHNEASTEIIRRAKELRRVMTPAEKLIWKFLKSRKANNQKFRRQHPIGRYILDFYCRESKLAIEIDGPIHETIEAQLK